MLQCANAPVCECSNMRMLQRAECCECSNLRILTVSFCPAFATACPHAAVTLVTAVPAEQTAHRTQPHTRRRAPCLRRHPTSSIVTQHHDPRTFYIARDFTVAGRMQRPRSWRSMSSPSSGLLTSRGLLERGRQALDGDDEGKSGGRRGRVHSQARRTVAAC